MHFKTSLLAAASLLVSPLPAQAQTGPLSQMIAATDSFTLANGLRVIVHTDRRTPVVAVNVWYNVGSKNEPAGKTGFAHLFEHLMFNGSENVPGDFFEPLKQMGATDYNGTTYFDRTNYFETVPTDALARALYLESDRMGWLTGAITQNVLDVQRGVVQNEKRQGDNQPYGLVQYHQVANLLPAGPPYAHTPIGSMKDLDTATLADVKGWFHDHYGPNNAVLVLAGDVDVATARPLVEKYFGSIARGPETTAPVAPVTPLTHPIAETISDRVAMVMIDRSWTVPGLNDKDSTALDVAAGVLGGLASSRLDNIMVRQEKLAVSVSATNASLAQIGTFTVHIMVRPGVNPAQVTARLDEIMRDFLSKGPTQAEVERVKTRQTVDTVETFESLNDKAQALAEGQLFSGDPSVVAKLTPADLRAFHQAWLRPDKAKVFVTSNLPLAQVQAMLDTAFGPWSATGQGGVKSFPANSRPAQPQIILVDRPDSPQSYVLAAYPNRLDPAQDAIPVQAANQALGGDFLSRLNMDLREEKHWTYGVRGRFQTSQHAMPYVVAAPVQADRTGDSIMALRTDLGAFLTQKPMTAPELARTVAGEIRSLPGSFANSETVLDAMQHNDLLGRPDDYYAHVAARYRSLTLEEANGAIRGAIDPASGIWIVVGDAKIVAPQLKALGLSFRESPIPMTPAK